jgi:hypothetical protein
MKMQKMSLKLSGRPPEIDQKSTGHDVYFLTHQISGKYSFQFLLSTK